MMHNSYTGRILMFCAIIIAISAGATGKLSADIFYTPSEYNDVYNEKVANEIELKSLKRQFNNERSNLKSRIKGLENNVDSLKKQIDLLQKQMKENKDFSNKRIRELEKRTDILKKKGSRREKALIEQNRRLQKRYEDELNKWQNGREQLRIAADKLKSGYEKRIAELEKVIAALNEELSDLKKLTDSQKQELRRMDSQADELENKLKEEIRKGEIRLKKLHGRLIINIDDRISFDSGSSKLKKAIFPALKTITQILSKYPENRIVIEGHTDNVPIHTKQFRNNWQLSTERALSVLQFILKYKKLNKKRFSAAGYGEYNPIVPNNSAANRSLNRRVDIVVIPRLKKRD